MWAGRVAVPLLECWQARRSLPFYASCGMPWLFLKYRDCWRTAGLRAVQDVEDAGDSSCK